MYMKSVLPINNKWIVWYYIIPSVVIFVIDVVTNGLLDFYLPIELLYAATALLFITHIKQFQSYISEHKNMYHYMTMILRWSAVIVYGVILFVLLLSQFNSEVYIRSVIYSTVVFEGIFILLLLIGALNRITTLSKGIIFIASVLLLYSLHPSVVAVRELLLLLLLLLQLSILFIPSNMQSYE